MNPVSVAGRGLYFAAPARCRPGPETMLRLQKKHSGQQQVTSPLPDAGQLLAEQSVGLAIGAGVAAVLLLDWIWAVGSVAGGRILPWLTIAIGAIVGVAVQRFGRGLDWRFPVIAALIAWTGAYLGNLLIYIDANPLGVLAGLSGDTIDNFFESTISPVDHIYAFCAAGVAAFFANRRLNRREVLALRTQERH